MCWLRSFLFKLCSTLLAGLSLCFSHVCRESSLVLFLQAPAAQLQRYVPSRVPQRERCLRRAEAPLGRGRVHKCVQQWARERKKRGRQTGWRKTTKAEDKQIHTCFQVVRKPLGKRVYARHVKVGLPPALKAKLSVRTVRRRLAEKGVKPERKLRKANRGPAWRRRRRLWCKKHKKPTKLWKQRLQGVADVKNFTFYTQRLKGKFVRFECAWTYMTKEEKQKPEFVLPETKFTRQEYKTVRQGKVFGVTLSSGQQATWVLKQPFTGDDFAELVRKKLGPFMAAAFPDHSKRMLLLGGEKLSHTENAKAALQEAGIRVLPDWPPYSLDLNPQENVWPWLETKLRESEQATDDFPKFLQRLKMVAQRYPHPENLIPSMEQRVSDCLAQRGGSIGN